jgi:hypothetical protein
MKTNKKSVDKTKQVQVVDVYDGCGVSSYVCDDKQCQVVSSCGCGTCCDCCC